MTRGALGASLAALLQLWSAFARAELAEDVAALASSWKGASAVTVLQPRFLTQSTELPLPFFPPARGQTPGCTTVALLSAPSTHFIVRRTPSEGSQAPSQAPWAEASVAGTVVVIRCGSHRRELDELVVEMRSPRGVLQVVIARGTKVPPSFERVLPHRNAGAPAAPSPIGPRPASPPVSERANVVRTRSTREGAAFVHERLVNVNADGTALLTFDLEPGCHRIFVLGEAGRDAPSPDIDAELSFEGEALAAASDRSEAADVTLVACTGAVRRALVAIAGARGGQALVMYARFALPSGLPERWGDAPRAAVARALFEQRFPSLADAPIFESLGVGGETDLPLELEPDACYVAAVAPLQGQLVQLGVSTRVGRRASEAHSEDPLRAPLVAFCARGEDHAVLHVDAHGSQATWVGALWQTGRLAPGADEGAP